jgi:hypothetical protein
MTLPLKMDEKDTEPEQHFPRKAPAITYIGISTKADTEDCSDTMSLTPSPDADDESDSPIAHQRNQANVVQKTQWVALIDAQYEALASKPTTAKRRPVTELLYHGRWREQTEFEG